MRWFCVLALWIVLSAGACSRKGGEVDTTKDVYTEDEAPKVQVQVLNGVTKEVPWAEVPENQQWVTEYDDLNKYKVRVPIVKVNIVSRDEKGNPVPPEQGHRVEYELITLNPKYFTHIYAGKDH
jgi:hypothetical protein